MKIRFDYYTTSVTLAANALVVGADADEISVNVDRWGDEPKWNVCGAVDHNAMAELFDYFEDNGFTEE